MNALLLKWLTSGIVCLVVGSAIWLAGSLKPHSSDLRYRLAAVSGSAQSLGRVERSHGPAAYSPDHAASAAMRRVVELR
jgi:hypothetical protein